MYDIVFFSLQIDLFTSDCANFYDCSIGRLVTDAWSTACNITGTNANDKTSCDVMITNAGGMRTSYNVPINQTSLNLTQGGE